MTKPREITRLIAPCTVGQLRRLLDAVGAPDTAIVRPFSGSLRIEEPTYGIPDEPQREPAPDPTPTAQAELDEPQPAPAEAEQSQPEAEYE